MKKWIWVFVFCFGAALWAEDANGGLSEEEFDRLERAVKISGVSDDTEEDDFDEKYEVLKFYTNQGEDNEEEYTFRAKVTIELTDKKKNTYFAQFARGQGDMSSEYTGVDTWEFWVPHGELGKLKVTAYVVEYGVLFNDKFIPLAEDTDDVDSAKELIARSPERIEITKTTHVYEFDSGDGEIETSMPN